MLRPKIEAVVRRGGGVVDPEVPTSLDDVAYWVTVSRTRTKTETMERTTELHGSVDANDAMAAFHGADSRIERLTGLPSSSGSVAPTQDALLNFVKDSAASSAPHATGGSGGGPCYGRLSLLLTLLHRRLFFQVFQQLLHS